jgi:hypothetical protein
MRSFPCEARFGRLRHRSSRKTYASFKEAELAAQKAKTVLKKFEMLSALLYALNGLFESQLLPICTNFLWRKAHVRGIVQKTIY